MNPPLHIVLVDDDEHLLFLVEHAVKDAFSGCDVCSFEDGELALGYVLNHPLDLIITDNQMPRMDGSELTSKLRHDGWNGPIVMMSGSPDAEQKGTAAGITRFVNKAASSFTSDLVTCISEVLRLASAPRINEELSEERPGYRPSDSP